MAGYYRFVLATTVVAFHAGFRPFGIQIGASAVVSFYLLSGFAMTGLFDSHYKELSTWKNFLVERFLRIFPQYYLWLLITLMISFGLGWWSDIYPEKEISANIITNAILLFGYAFGIFFQNLVEWNPIGITTSLANEEVFYLIAPLLFVHRILFDLIAWLSLLVFGLSLVGLIENNVYTYYYLPGPLVYMYIGYLISRKSNKKLFFYALALIFALFFVIKTNNLNEGLNAEIFIGIIFGAITVPLLSLRNSRISKVFGDSSYGIFLSHTAILVTLKHFNIAKDSAITFGTLLILLSWITGYLSFSLVEKPTVNFRRKFRTKV